jgi:hypothetical protein
MTSADVVRGSNLYYRFHRDTGARRRGLRLARIASQPDLGKVWRTGERFDQTFPVPLRCTLDPRGGPDLPDAFLADRIPLFSDRLVEALRGAGVDNLDCYETELVESSTGKVYRQYKAVNIIGKVLCVDLEQSAYDPESQFPMIEFERIVVDPARIGVLRMFRLAENPAFILVAEPLKRVLERESWRGVAVFALDDLAAY